jgi:hypothetical protein
MREVFISIPAWGKHYVEMATKYTLPAIVASLGAWEPRLRATFIIHTDDRAAFRKSVAGLRINFRPVRRGIGAGNLGDWVAFERAHREAIALTPKNGLLVLLNSDTVVSIETMRAVDAALAGRRKVGVSVGIRTLIDGNSCPVGATAGNLARWCWNHRHPLTDDMIWGTGAALQPTQMFFPHDDEEQVVSMHCFHLTPMFIVKDRDLNFGGTIDDGLLFNYSDGEIVYFHDRPFTVAELSPLNKHHPRGKPLRSVEAVTMDDKRWVHPAHLRNFKQQFTVLGKPMALHPAAEAVIKRLEKLAAPRG